ncbi:MAG: methylmalonyl-CoA epimerase [Euryarchaeota archaeon]|nr:methylmalonyl-CoA epimerase [Euryarchaeota archaeon]
MTTQSEGTFPHAPEGLRVQKIDHLGVAVHSIEEALPMYAGILGLECVAIETVEDQKVKTAFLPVGGTNIELLEPTAPDSPVAKFLDKRGPGVHHVAYRVDDVARELERLKGEGVRLVDETPRRGAGGALIAFLHPKATGGILVELCQRDSEHH